MARDLDGVATRDDVLTLGPNQDYETSHDGEPTNKCVPLFELEGKKEYVISGTYEHDQLLRFQDIAFVYIPRPEPEPEGQSIGYEIHDYNPYFVGSSEIPVTGGSTTWYWRGHVWDTMHGYTFPDEYTFVITDYQWEDPNKKFDVSLSSDHTRMTFSTTYDNTNKDQYSYRLKVYVQVSDPNNFGTVNDWFTVDISQAGLQYTYVIRNNRVVYSNGGNILLANGSNTCQIVTELTKVTIKPDGTRQSGTTQTNFVLKPSYVLYDGDDVDKIICHTADTPSGNYISASDRGTTAGTEYKIREVYGWWTFNTTPVMTVRTFPDTFTIRQEANKYERTEVTTAYSNLMITSGTLGQDENDRFLITSKGTNESYYDNTGYYHSERTVIVPDMFTAVRHYEYYVGYTAQIESGIYQSHGTASGWTQMKYVEVPSAYNSYAKTQVVHNYNPDTGYDVEMGTDWIDRQPRLLIYANSHDYKHNFYVNAWTDSEYEANPLKAQFQLSQYEATKVFITPEIVSAGFAKSDYPNQAVTSLPFSASGETSAAMLIVTADCRVRRYTITDGVTTPETVTQCTGRTSNTQTLQVTLNPVNQQWFTIKPWDPTTVSDSETFYPENNEMLLRHYSYADHLAIRVYPRSANTTSYNVVSKWMVMYSADSNNYVTQEVEITHERDTSAPSITVSPTAIYQQTSIASSGTITVNSSVSDWSCSSSTSWLSAQKSNGNVSWGVTAYENASSTSERTGTITVWSSNEFGTASATVTVKQPPRYLFQLTQYATTIQYTDDNHTGGTINLTSSETTFSLAVVSRRVTCQTDTYGYEIMNVDYWDVYDGSGGPIAQTGEHTLTGGTISTGGSGANIYYYVPLNIPQNMSTTSTKTSTVEVFQKSTEIGYGPSPNKLTITVIQAMHAPPAETALDFFDVQWVSYNSKFYVGLHNRHTSRAINVSTLWYYQIPQNPNDSYSYYNYADQAGVTIPTTVQPSTTLRTSIEISTTNPWQFIYKTSDIPSGAPSYVTAASVSWAT